MSQIHEPHPLPNLALPGFRHGKINSVEIYRFDRELTRLQNGDDKKVFCGILILTSNGFSGWSEYRLLCTKQTYDLVGWASVFMYLKNLEVADAFRLLNSKAECWGKIRTELAETALRNLVSRQDSPLPLLPYRDMPLDKKFLIEHSEAYVSF